MRSEGKNRGEAAQTPPVSLRLAGADDEGFLFQVYAAGRRKEMESWGLEGAQLEAMLNLQFRAQRQHYEIAFEGAEHSIILSDDRAIGRMLVYRSQQEIRLVDIALLPDSRGKGIGSSLIIQLQAEAEASSKPLTLHVDQSNRAARLYERLGFEVVADRGTYFMMKWTSRRNSQ